MTQLVNVVLKDSTSVNHTFKPRGSNDGVATLVESTGVPIGERVLTLSSKPTQTGRQKFVARVQIPIVQDVTVNGVSKPTVVRVGYADVTFTTDGTANVAERADLVYFTRDVLANGMVWDMMVGLESAY